MIEVVRLSTPLCQQLGIEHPIFCAGMGAAAGPELAAAVSGAGGLGVLAAAAPPEEIRRRAVAAWLPAQWRRPKEPQPLLGLAAGQSFRRGGLP